MVSILTHGHNQDHKLEFHITYHPIHLQDMYICLVLNKFLHFDMLDHKLVLGSVYASDARRPPKAYLRWAISRMSRPGAIIILHVGPGRTHTIDILPDIAHRIHAKGLKFVTLDELMSSAKAV